jgi:hypothetical protein
MNYKPPSSRSIYPKAAVMESLEDVISVRQILPPYFGYTLTKTITGSYSMNFTSRGKRLIASLELSTAKELYHLLRLLTAIQAERNGFKSLPKEVSTSHRQQKKSGQTSTRGLDMVSRKLLKNSNRLRGKVSPLTINRLRKVAQDYLSLCRTISAYQK